MEPYDRGFDNGRSRSGLPLNNPSTTANASATTVQENDTTAEPVLVEDNDNMEGQEESVAQLDGGGGEGEQMGDGENRTDREDDRNRDTVVTNDANWVNSARFQDTMPMFGKFTDQDVLDCPICCEALTAPVFQCDNGHLQCSRCCIIIGNKCPSCSFPIGNNRCRSIERILNSVHFPCRNVFYGCKEAMLHNKREVHEKACIFAPCYCPIELCDFVGSPKNMYAHFRGSHSSSAVQFEYTRPFNLILEDKNNCVILQEKTDGTIFILNHAIANNRILHGINLICNGVFNTKEVFCYELFVRYEGSTVKFNSFAAFTRKWRSQILPLGRYLLVPSDFVNPNGSISVVVCIQKRRIQ